MTDSGLWEVGANRWIEVPNGEWKVENGPCRVYELEQAFFELCDERFAGTLVPVFSLRSAGGCGVGDFGDLYNMVEWVNKTGQRVLQILPINDTTQSGTWQDSYPYNAISIFALHPQYIDLRQLPKLKDKVLLKQLERERKELNALPQIDYERVNALKMSWLQALYANGQWKLDDEQWLAENEHWLKPYAQFRIENESARGQGIAEPAEFYYWLQYVLSVQLKRAHSRAQELGVILKGDIPIGVNRHGCDVLTDPQYFNLNAQAGAPPDDFSETGQNWGFPTYNWEAMLADGCKWWERRFKNMAQYFDAYRIDHVLGFFRIWEIPIECESGYHGQFSPALPLSIEEIRSYGFEPENIQCDIESGTSLFLKDHRDASKYHPHIGAHKSQAYSQLDYGQQQAFDHLYHDFFYRRHNQFWYGEAMKKLPMLVEATRMLVCAEDLGMVPDCVAWVMNRLKILSLEVESMPKALGVQFADLTKVPYRSVCCFGSHDMPTLRQWWDEDYSRAWNYYNYVLGHGGDAPHPLPGWLAREVIAHQLQSASMICVLSIQDYFAIDESLRLADKDAERINIPANPRHYWRYRMHVNIEDLMANENFNENLSTLIKQNGR